MEFSVEPQNEHRFVVWALMLLRMQNIIPLWDRAHSSHISYIPPPYARVAQIGRPAECIYAIHSRRTPFLPLYSSVLCVPFHLYRKLIKNSTLRNKLAKWVCAPVSVCKCAWNEDDDGENRMRVYERVYFACFLQLLSSHPRLFHIAYAQSFFFLFCVNSTRLDGEYT